MPVNRNIVGQRFGRLIVLDEYRSSTTTRGTEWKCRCDCGHEMFIYRGKLLSGHTRSCGCINRTLNGESNSLLYRKWWSIKERCYSANHNNYKNYGGKGIELCHEWHDFNVFRDWAITNGYREDLTIDRLDATKHYTPHNCRWIPLSQNVAEANRYSHRRKTKYLYYGIDANDNYYEFANASAFAKERFLEGNSVRKVARGEGKTHKGWTFGYTDKPNQ